MTMPSNKPTRGLWYYTVPHGAALFALNAAGVFCLYSILEYLDLPTQAQPVMRMSGAVVALIYAAFGGWLRWQLKPILIGMLLTTGLFVGNLILLVLLMAALVYAMTSKIRQAKDYFFLSPSQGSDEDSLPESDEL